MKLWWIPAGAAALVVVASVVPGPYSSVKQTIAGSGQFLQSAQLDPSAVAVLKRACGNCHSHETTWPWYSRVAPMSWLVQKDVSEGRKFLNFSVWPEYGPEGQKQLLALSGAQVKSGAMPPQRYLLLHKEATLNSPEQTQLIALLEQEAVRLSKADRPSQ